MNAPQSKKKCLFFCAFGDCGYIDYDVYYIYHYYLENESFIIGYLDIDILATSTTMHWQQLQSMASASSLASMTLMI
jgi:hypothetical protein